MGWEPGVLSGPRAFYFVSLHNTNCFSSIWIIWEFSLFPMEVMESPETSIILFKNVLRLLLLPLPLF